MEHQEIFNELEKVIIIGNIYTSKELKDIFTDIYNRLSVPATPKGTHIKRYYHIDHYVGTVNGVATRMNKIICTSYNKNVKMNEYVPKKEAILDNYEDIADLLSIHIKEGEYYTSKEIKSILKPIYKQLHLALTPTGSDLLYFYKTANISKRINNKSQRVWEVYKAL